MALPPGRARLATRRTATRVTPGAILLEQPQPFSAHAVFVDGEPGRVTAGCARLAMKPAPTGSMTVANTIGMALVACSNGATVAVPVAARRTSGVSATSSAACL
jgi:hypothetical protein